MIKKPLIIVPPMSESLANLKKVLEQVADAEGIEIYTVNDVKEFSQLVSIVGQALVIMNNAKLCATFLKENRGLLAGNKSKVLLMSPKPIPAPTLLKFTKIGLTESIVESTVPKSLLYKVRLLLRSIQGSAGKSEGGEQKVLKSMIDVNDFDDSFLKTKKLREEDEENPPEEGEIDLNEKNESNQYSTMWNSKKKQQQAESIQTYWETKKKKDEEIDLGLTSNPEKSTEESSDEEVGYYKRKKTEETQLDLSVGEHEAESIYEESAYSLKKERPLSLVEEIYGGRTKNLVAEEEEDQKRHESETETIIQIEEGQVKEKQKSSELEFEKNKNDQLAHENAEDIIADIIRSAEQEIILKTEEDKTLEELALAARKREQKKSSLNELEFENNPLESSLEEDEQLSELVKDEGLLDLIDQPKESEEEDSDKLGKYQRNKKNDNETELELSSKKEETQTFDENQEDLKKNLIEEAKELNIDFDSQKKNEETSGLPQEEDNELRKENIGDLQFGKEEEGGPSLEVDLEANSNVEAQSPEEIQDFTNVNPDSKSLNLLDGDRQKNKSELENRSEDVNILKKKSETELVLDKGIKERQSSKAERINTYYNSQKEDEEQDWDLLKKDNSFKLELKRKEREDEFLKLKEKVIAVEEVIDYNVLRKEFDEISREEIDENTAISKEKDNADAEKENGDDLGKVFEPNLEVFTVPIEILNLMYAKDANSDQLLDMTANFLRNQEAALMVGFKINQSNQNLDEIFNAFVKYDFAIRKEVQDYWSTLIKDDQHYDLYKGLDMPTWMCREMDWKDIELPSWASQELINKPVELIYPFLESTKVCGYVHVLFFQGIKPENAQKILMALDSLRTVFLDTPFAKMKPSNEVTSENPGEVSEEEKNPPTLKKQIINIFKGLKSSFFNWS